MVDKPNICEFFGKFVETDPTCQSCPVGKGEDCEKKTIADNQEVETKTEVPVIKTHTHIQESIVETKPEPQPDIQKEIKKEAAEQLKEAPKEVQKAASKTVTSAYENNTKPETATDTSIPAPLVEKLSILELGINNILELQTGIIKTINEVPVEVKKEPEVIKAAQDSGLKAVEFKEQFKDTGKKILSKDPDTRNSMDALVTAMTVLTTAINDLGQIILNSVESYKAVKPETVDIEQEISSMSTTVANIADMKKLCDPVAQTDKPLHGDTWGDFIDYMKEAFQNGYLDAKPGKKSLITWKKSRGFNDSMSLIRVFTWTAVNCYGFSEEQVNLVTKDYLKSKSIIL